MDTSKFKYCPVCRAGLEPNQGEEVEAPKCPQCGRVFYSAPHPTVCALIVDDSEERVLLTRRGIEPYKDWWDIPGGFVQAGESLEECLRREMKEELGVELKILELVGSYPDRYGSDELPTLCLFYLVKIAGGELVPGSDVTGFEWFHRSKLPERIAFGTGRQALLDWLKLGKSFDTPS